jgi:hypothetical protein
MPGPGTGPRPGGSAPLIYTLSGTAWARHGNSVVNVLALWLQTDTLGMRNSFSSSTTTMAPQSNIIRSLPALLSIYARLHVSAPTASHHQTFL